MGFFTEAYKVLDGKKPTCETKDDINRDEASELKPGKGGGIDAKPHCLTDNDIRFGGFSIGKALMEEINDGQDNTGDRRQSQNEKSPAGPDIRISLRKEKI